MTAIFLAIIASIFFGILSASKKIASPHINQILGAILLSCFAVLFGLIILISRLKEIELTWNSKGIFFILLAGIAAFCVDFFGLKAYSSGLPVSIGSPIIVAGGVTIASLIGIFLLGESLNIWKFAGVILVVLGTILLFK